VQGFHVEVAHPEHGRSRGNFGEDRLRTIIAVEQAVFRPLLVVDHEAEGDASITGPTGMGRLGAVAAEIAFVGLAQDPFPENATAETLLWASRSALSRLGQFLSSPVASPGSPGERDGKRT